MKKGTVFIIAVICTVIATILGGYLFSIFLQKRIVDNLMTQYASSQGIVAQQIAQTLELEIAQTEVKLNLIAQLPDVVSGSTEICNAKLIDLVKNPQTKVGNIGRVYPDGTFHCSVNTKLIGIKANKLGQYIDTIFDDEKHASVMSRAIKPPGSDSYVVAIHVPVWGPHHEFLGTLGGAVYLSEIEKQYLGSKKLPANSAIVMLDDDGTILSHFKKEFIGKNYGSLEYQKLLKNVPPAEKIIEGVKEGTSGVLYPILEGVPRITAFEPVYIFPQRNWRVSVTVPTASAYESIAPIGVEKLFTTFMASIAFLVILIYGIFIYLIMVKVFRPMELIDKAKTEFVSLASHQLRAPLTSIKWYTELLLEKISGTINDDQKNYLEEIESATTRMVDLVSSLLNVSRLELGTFIIEPKENDLLKVVGIAVREQEPTFKVKGQKFIFTHPENIPPIIIDEKLTHVIIQNLLSNAQKYTQKNGTIILSIKIVGTKEANGYVSIACSDNGYGIPKDQQGKIFKKLFRADNATKLDVEGTGLGLYIIKTVVDAAKCSIDFISEENKGTTFTFKIPLKGMST